MYGQKAHGDGNDGCSHYGGGGSADRGGNDDYHHEHYDNGHEEGGEGEDDGAFPWSRRRQRRNQNKRARSKARHARQQRPPPLDLSVVGVPSVLHRDDGVAGYLDGGDHLIDYHGGADAPASSSSSPYAPTVAASGWSPECEELGGFDAAAPRSDAGAEHRPLLIDRFDGRARLMDDYESFRGDGIEDEPTADGCYRANERHGLLASPDGEGDNGTDEDVREELNLERYGLLPEYEGVFGGSSIGAMGGSAKTADGGEEDDAGGPPGSSAAVASTRQINEDGKTETTAAAEGQGQGQAAKSYDEVAPFEPTFEERCLLPPGTKLPATARQNDVMVMTASKSASSEQFEVLLKLKQGGNDLFAFLRPGDTLHPYYIHLKRRAGAAVQGGEGGGGCSTADGSKASSVQRSKVQNDNGDDGSEAGMGVGLVDYASSSADDDDDQICFSNGGPRADDAGGGTMSLVACYSSSGDEGDDTPENVESSGSANGNVDSKVTDTNRASDEPGEKDSTEDYESGATTMRETSPALKKPGSASGIATPALPSANAPEPSVKDSATPIALQRNRDVAAGQDPPDEVKAKRLKRARLMKGHFALKMLDSK